MMPLVSMSARGCVLWGASVPSAEMSVTVTLQWSSGRARWKTIDGTGTCRFTMATVKPGVMRV